MIYRLPQVRHNQTRVYRHYAITNASSSFMLSPRPRLISRRQRRIYSHLTHPTSFVTTPHYLQLATWRIATTSEIAIKNCNSKFKIEKVAKFEFRMSVLSNARRLSLSLAGRRRAWAGGMQMRRESLVRGCSASACTIGPLERPTSPPVTVVFRSASN